MATGVTEVLTDGSSGKRSKILQRSGVTCRSSHHHRVIHCFVLFQGIYNVGNGRTFLTDSHINAINRIARFVVGTLVNDGIQGNSRFTRLTVANEQLTLSATDRNHRIDSLQTRLQRLVNRLTEDHSRCLALQRHLIKLTADASFTVERFAQRVNNASQHAFTNHDRSNSAGTFHRKALLNLISRTEQHGTHVILFQVHHNGFNAVVELQKFVSLSVIQSVNTCHTVTHLQHGTYFIELHASLNAFELFAQHIRDLTYSYIF